MFILSSLKCFCVAAIPNDNRNHYIKQKVRGEIIECTLDSIISYKNNAH